MKLVEAETSSDAGGLGGSVEDMVGANQVISIKTARSYRDNGGGSERLLNIKQVSDQCGLPGPVIVQLVPDTWTEAGRMYTPEQASYAVRVAEDLRRRRTIAVAASAPGLDSSSGSL